eukprot:1157445-Pelagomonas_calceolata.AAC.13
MESTLQPRVKITLYTVVAGGVHAHLSALSHHILIIMCTHPNSKVKFSSTTTSGTPCSSHSKNPPSMQPT